MIYLIIADISDFLKNNGDCQAKWQSHSPLCEEIENYISNCKNERARMEKYTAYHSLALSLDKFYNIKKFGITRSENGKPYLINKSPALPSDAKEIYISISHSLDSIAVALTDEGEIGVDIQGEDKNVNTLRIEKRFLYGISPENKLSDITCFRLIPSESFGEFVPLRLCKNEDNDFYRKWTFAESVIKCLGLDFSCISKINDLAKNTESISLKYKNSVITIAKKA